MDLNLYKTQLKKDLETEAIIEFSHLKLTQFNRNGETIYRLTTTSRSTCKKSKNVDLFEYIPLGDFKIDGKVVAIDNIFPYHSCSKCWKKVGNDINTSQCGNNDNPIKDFHCQFYIEKQNDNDI